MPRPVDTWLLPEGVADVLPAEAVRLEALRRRLLDRFAGWGYQLVFPPLMEYLDSLLTGSGHDLDLMTFKITDQLTGRMMGVRADITPQVARLDAHSLPVEGAARYCYAGTTLNTRPATLAASRCPVQIGAELYGYAGVAGDIEILRLMLESLAIAGCRGIQLDLGHVAIFRGLARLAQLGEREESQLFDIYQRKAVAELRDFLAAHVTDSAAASRFEALLKLSGDAGVLAQAKKLLGGLAPEIDEALQSLEAVAAALQVSHADVALYFDLTELRGYHYHTGLVFAAYVPGSRAELAKGGRYDAVGEAFGRARPATGFSADLKSLLAYFSDADAAAVIQAPAGDDAALRTAIAALREQGERVLQALPGEGEATAGRVLRLQDGQWRVATL
ncbi:MAG TPA: ATP phosphoribosyltransferase regulatory subunit [Moraxellaceae bacterium]